ncbi:MAG: ThuA domain-containing protein [Planctomycetes bacterium]|nr:ThuA domain-containing protein [Planctomycetota bacterium]
MNPLRCLVLLASILVPAAFPARESRAQDRVQRILLLGQKPDSHPATTHEYMAGVQLLARLLSRSTGIQTVVVQADSPWNDGPELLDGADAAVLFLTEGARWISDDRERLAAFQRLARRGGGLTCLHWGMGTREAGPIAEFTALFGRCHGGPDRKYAVVAVTASPDANHPILSGIQPFEVRDEFYYSLKTAGPESRLKATSLIRVSIDGTDQSVAWSGERNDGGRSFGFSGLHFHENWKLKEYRRLVLQGVHWTLKRPIPESGLDVELADRDFALPKDSPRE